MVETYMALAREAEGSRRFEDDGIIGCRSDSKHPAANFSVVARPNSYSVARLADGEPHTAYVLPTDQSQSVIEMMRKAGFTPGLALNLMFQRNPDGGVNLDLQSVKDISSRYELTLFLARQFFANAHSGFCEGIAAFTAAARRCELLQLAGRTGPAGGAMVFQTGDTLGLYNISVAPEYRHKGLGSELVRSLAAIAASRQCTATLQCHDSLVPWYERLGFRKYAEVVMMRN